VLFFVPQEAAEAAGEIYNRQDVASPDAFVAEKNGPFGGIYL